MGAPAGASVGVGVVGVVVIPGTCAWDCPPCWTPQSCTKLIEIPCKALW